MLDHHVDHHAVLQAECARVSAMARTTPHDLPIAHLPGWTVHDAVAHLAGDFLWVLGTLATRGRPTVGLVAVETRGTALCDEWDAVADRLIAALDGVDPDEPCPNFAFGDAGTLGWHIRHQALETTIHRWDIESATGTHAPIDADVAAGGVTELLEVYTQRYGGQVLDRPITLGCVGRSERWCIAPADEPGRVTVEVVHTTVGHPDVQAAPGDLLLMLWHRLAVDDSRVTYRSNAASAKAFLSGPLTA